MAQSLLTLLLILMPMFIGIFLPTHKKTTQYAEKGLNYVILIILLVIGIELGNVQDIQQKISSVTIYLITLMVLTIGFGSVALIIFEKICQYPYPRKERNTQLTQKSNLKDMLVQPFYLILGFTIAKIFPEFELPKVSITILLMILLLLVGICLKGSGANIKQVLFNKYGLQMSVVFMVATLFGGVVFSWIFDDVSITQGLALASGFGWYSLSGTIMTDAYGVIWGSVALFNDLGRELLALLFIPYIMRFFPTVAVGLGGVTSLDFTLPTLTQSGGIQITPLAVSFGFITNVLSPVFMVVFSAFPA